MKVRYRNDLYGNYMLIPIPEETDTNQYTFKMLSKNKIAGVLTCRERLEDGKSYMYVDISHKRSLMQEYEDKEMQLEDMIAVFQQIVQVLEEIRMYLLHESMVIMNPEYIYRDLENDDLYVLILPWEESSKTFHKLAEFFLEKVNHKDENGVNAAYLFYRQQSQPQFSLYQFLSILEKESILKRQKLRDRPEYFENNIDKKEELGTEKEKNIMQDVITYPEDEEEKVSAITRERTRIRNVSLLLFIIFLIISFLPVLSSLLKISCIAFAMLFLIVSFVLFFTKEKELPEEDIPMQEIEVKETVYFKPQEEDLLKLQWKERGRKKQFILEEFPCIVGKMQEEVSIVISDLSVSRVHCKFIKKENKVCIMDLNSTNGTFLNGLPIKNGEIQEIEKNDEILIGKVRLLVV